MYYVYVLCVLCIIYVLYVLRICTVCTVCSVYNLCTVCTKYMCCMSAVYTYLPLSCMRFISTTPEGEVLMNILQQGGSTGRKYKFPQGRNTIEALLKGLVSMHYSSNRAIQECFNSVSSLRRPVLPSCVHAGYNKLLN